MSAVAVPEIACVRERDFMSFIRREDDESLAEQRQNLIECLDSPRYSNNAFHSPIVDTMRDRLAIIDRTLGLCE